VRIVVSNQYLRTQLNDTRLLLNANCSLRLFYNNFFPAPGNLLNDFAEPTYAGYARQPLTGAFPVPLKVYDGLYESRTAQFTFISTTPAIQLIHGWFIADAFNVWLSFRFDTVRPIRSGLPIRFIIALQDGDASLLCP